MKINLESFSKEEITSIKESFFHIYHSFLNEGFLSKDFVGCLLKWGVQLHLTDDDLEYINPSYEKDEVLNREDKLEHIYNIVFMIYLDGKVEDMELELVTRYAEKTGFQSHIVNDLLKTIVTAPYDGFSFTHVKKHLKEIIE